MISNTQDDTEISTDFWIHIRTRAQTGTHPILYITRRGGCSVVVAANQQDRPMTTIHAAPLSSNAKRGRCPCPLYHC